MKFAQQWVGIDKHCWVSWLHHQGTLKMEAVRTSEMSVNFNVTTCATSQKTLNFLIMVFL
jgi:hypothetical protein